MERGLEVSALALAEKNVASANDHLFGESHCPEIYSILGKPFLQQIQKASGRQQEKG